MLRAGAMKCPYFLQALGSQVTPMPRRRQVLLWHSAYDKQKRWFPHSSTKRHPSTSEQPLACGFSGTAGLVPFPLSTVLGTAMDARGGGHLGQSPWRCCQFTLWPPSATDLSPKTSWALPLLAQQVHFHSLQPPIFSSRSHAVQRHQECNSAQAVQGMLRHPPQSGIRPDLGFLCPTVLQVPIYFDSAETFRANNFIIILPPLIPICDFLGVAPDLLPGWDRELILCKYYLGNPSDDTQGHEFLL